MGIKVRKSSKWVFRMWLSCPPHFLQIVVEVKTSGRPHVKDCGWGKHGHATCKIPSHPQIYFLCQLNILNIIMRDSVEVNLSNLSFKGDYRI